MKTSSQRQLSALTRRLAVVHLRLQFCAVVAAIAFTSGTPSTADQTPNDSVADITLQIEIDTETGGFTASSLLPHPQGDVVLPDAEWIDIETLAIAGGEVPLDGVTGGVIGPEQHQNQAVHLRVSGTFPEPTRQMGIAASDGDATHVVGPAWFPTDERGVLDHIVTVRVPSGQTVAATGALLSEVSDTSTTETQFAFTGFSSDLGLFIGPYDVAERRSDDLRLRTYFEAANPNLSDRYFEAAEAYIARFEAEIGEYPYDGFSVVSTTMPVGLGFAGLTYVSRDILSHPYMTGRSLAHEILHSWWGNAVGIDYEAGNWAEGLTTFQADYGLAEDAGPEAARMMRVSWIRALAELPEDDRQPLTAFRSSTQAQTQSEGYGKAAMVFHMLRDELGAEVFSEGVRAFYAAQRNTVASWQDIQAAFETASGQDLGWFFEQWTTRPGLPNISLDAGSVAQTSDGTYLVSFDLRQTDPYYRLLVPVVINTEAGEVRSIVRHEGAVDTVTIELENMPTSVLVDPDFDLARAPLEGELAPILRAISGQEIVALAASSQAGSEVAVANALAPLISSASLSWQTVLDPLHDGPVLVAGSAAEIARFVPQDLNTRPELEGAGGSSIWIERDRDGRLWVFLAFENTDDLAADLQALRFYTGQSYVVAAQGTVTTFGTWENSSDAVALSLDMTATDF